MLRQLNEGCTNMADITISFDGLAAKLAGVAGAVVSMRFVQGTWIERLFMAIGGATLSYFAAPYLAAKSGLPEGLSGFLLGLFGMAVASRIWEWIQTTPITEVWGIALNWLRRKLGVAEKPEVPK